MKTLIVTSKVHFVPNNYDDLILNLADNPHVAGLLIINNGGNQVKTALGLIIFGAYRIGWQMLRNIFSGSTNKRIKRYREKNKPVWIFPSINTPACQEILRKNDFDLFLNARTRIIYNRATLSIPQVGCLNIHHGLLPEQRGLLCDLWALSLNQPAGFTIHQMTDEIDAGKIISKVQTSDGQEKDYLKFLTKSIACELKTVNELLAHLADKKDLTLIENSSSPAIIYRNNPSKNDLNNFKKRGIKL